MRKKKKPRRGDGASSGSFGGNNDGEGKTHQMPILNTAAAVTIIKDRQFSGLFDADASRKWPFRNILPLNAQNFKKPDIGLFAHVDGHTRFGKLREDGGSLAGGPGFFV